MAQQVSAKTTRTRSAAPKAKKTKLGRIDMPMLTIIIILLMFGLVMLYSASYANGYLRYKDSYAYIRPQLMYTVVGLVGMAGATLIDYRIWRKFAWPLMIVTVIMLVVVLFMPEKNGASRWIWLNSAQTRSIQPSEFAKFAVILLFGSLIYKHDEKMKTFKYGFMPFIGILGVVSFLLLKEPHLSCTVLILGIGVSMMFAGGAPARLFGIGIIGGAVLLFVVAKYPDVLPHAAKRIIDWQESLVNVQDMEYQTYQSLIAVGSGGIKGRGIGNSRQKYLYLPEMHNDYIFAVLCEELGMVGAIVTMALFIIFLARGLYIASRTSDKFGAMLVVGITVQVALQAFLHMAVNINAIPSTGISMPFFSSGGSSLVMLLGQMGIVLSVSRGMDAAPAGNKNVPQQPVGVPQPAQGPPVPATTGPAKRSY